MYDIGNAMYDKAERYYNAVMVFNEREIFDAPFIVLIFILHIVLQVYEML